MRTVKTTADAAANDYYATILEEVPRSVVRGSEKTSTRLSTHQTAVLAALRRLPRTLLRMLPPVDRRQQDKDTLSAVALATAHAALQASPQDALPPPP